MKCPHCLTAFHDNRELVAIGDDADSRWTLLKRTCPECQKFVLSLHQEYESALGGIYLHEREFLVYPRAMSRSPLSEHVPEDYAEDYREACLVLPESPKASAAISRRCLQHLLRGEARVKHSELAKEIRQVLDEQRLPLYLLESLDAVRNIGNFAAHPIKSTASGEVIDVEPGEAEWNLDVLESLFDFYFVQPTVLRKRQDALNVKLREAGKPEIKKPSDNGVQPAS